MQQYEMAEIDEVQFSVIQRERRVLTVGRCSRFHTLYLPLSLYLIASTRILVSSICIMTAHLGLYIFRNADNMSFDNSFLAIDETL